MNDEKSPIIFTPEGRKEVCSRLKHLGLLACENGFLDSAEGFEVSDINALNILQQPTAETLSLNDQAEVILGRVIECIIHAQCPQIGPLYHPVIDDLWTKLNEARKRAGRPAPI